MRLFHSLLWETIINTNKRGKEEGQTGGRKIGECDGVVWQCYDDRDQRNEMQTDGTACSLGQSYTWLYIAHNGKRMTKYSRKCQSGQLFNLFCCFEHSWQTHCLS